MHNSLFPRTFRTLWLLCWWGAIGWTGTLTSPFCCLCGGGRSGLYSRLYFWLFLGVIEASTRNEFFLQPHHFFFHSNSYYPRRKTLKSFDSTATPSCDLGGWWGDDLGKGYIFQWLSSRWGIHTRISMIPLDHCLVMWSDENSVSIVPLELSNLARSCYTNPDIIFQ